MRGRDDRGILCGIPCPVFLANFNETSHRLTLHVRSGCNISLIGAAARSALERNGLTIKDVDVRTHNMGRLTYPRSLERWLEQFDSGDIAHDPMLMAARARFLVDFVKRCRVALNGAMAAAYFDPRRRMLFVVAQRGADVGTVSFIKSRIAAIADSMRSDSATRSDGDMAMFLHSTQVVTAPPRSKLVPVDAMSATMAFRLKSLALRWLAPGAVAVGLATMSLPAAASHHPAQREVPLAIGSQVAGTSSDFGVISGLSVLADGPGESGALAASGLQLFFGDANGGPATGEVVIAQVDVPVFYTGS